MKLLDAGLVVTSVAALVLTASAVATALRPLTSTRPLIERVNDWRSYSSAGHLSGPSNARVMIVEFADFECRYCAKVALELAKLKARYPKDVALVFRHFPLSGIHPNAWQAARAAECAARQGRFDSVAAVIFAFQDSLGRRSWTWFAQRGGVADTAAFAACARERGDAAAIAADIAAGERLGVRGTPTIIMNEWRFSLPPSGEAMDSMVKAILRRR